MSHPLPSLLLDWREGEARPAPPADAYRDANGWCWFDGRLDHRDTLARTLGVDAETDQQLILEGWRKAQDKLLALIEGDFALLLFDGQLVAARDALGGRPLHFAVRDQRLLVAQGPRAIARALGDVAVDSARLAGFAMALPDTGPASFFEGVDRLPPGHLLRGPSPARMASEPWWSPRLGAFSGSASASVERIDALLDRSVAGLDHARRPALELTSGLDSNLLLSRLAARHPHLVAICGVPEAPIDPARGFIGDESGPAARAAAAFGVDFRRAVGPATGVIETSATFAAYERPPFNPGNTGWLDAVHGEARSAGVDLIVQGGLGNFTVSWSGESGLSEALFRKDAGSILVELRRALAGGVREAKGIVYETLVDRLPGPLVRAAAARSFALAARSAMVREAHPAVHCALAHELTRRRLPHRFTHRLADPGQRLRVLVHGSDRGLYNLGTERRFGIPVRDAFATPALVEACLSTPAHHFRDAQGERAIARALLDPRVPADIRAGTIDAVQGSNWRRAMEAERDAMIALVDWAGERETLAGIFDLGEARRRLIDWPTEGWNRMPTYHAYRIRLATLLTALAFARWVEEEA